MDLQTITYVIVGLSFALYLLRLRLLLHLLLTR